ncbi:MAG: S8 family serine peptidase, partial [Acidobacteria bacterium]|nr:S8 family serine peptidase [Acidobacteriota bacterium]
MIEAGSAPGQADLANFSTGSTATSFAASGVGAGTYYVRVRATNAFGTSGPSNEATLSVGSSGAAKQASVAALVEKVGDGGLVPVIVGFRAAFVVPEGLLAPGTITAQRESIARVRETILAQMPRGSVGSIKRYETIPYVAAVVDADALRILGGLTDVASVVEDVPEPPTPGADGGLAAAAPLWREGVNGAGWSVAVLDTGIDQTRAFLTQRVISEACYSTDSSVSSSLCPDGEQASTAAGAGARCADNVSGCDHGTRVARVVAGHGDGVTGVAPGASVLSMQVFSRFEDSDYCEDATPCVLSWASDQIAALERVLMLTRTNQIASVTLSVGAGRYASDAACDEANGARTAAIDNLRSVGVATVISSGSDGYADAVAAPGCISAAVAVGATAAGGTLATYANRHPAMLELLAPDAPSRSDTPGHPPESVGGISTAAARVAGAWALLKQAATLSGQSLSVAQGLHALRETGKPVEAPAGSGAEAAY